MNGRRKSAGRSVEMGEGETPNAIAISLPSIRASAASFVKQRLEDRAYYKMAMA